MIIKLKLIFNDRVGIVADLSAIIAAQDLNIVSMEVERVRDEAHVYLELERSLTIGEDHDPAVIRRDIPDILGRVADVRAIRFIDTMPHEARENQFRVVLDNISDGVISIDRKARVTTINHAAREALDCDLEMVIGSDIRHLNLPDFSILDCLDGKRFSGVKKDLITDRGRVRYIATGQPIRDKSGRIIGAVEIARDIREIKRLARSISETEKVDFSDIIGQNPAIVNAIDFAQKIAPTDSIISIRGASGSGKELFARAIHDASGRSGSFVPINCAAVPEQLLESELFGYVGGTFTGGRREGRPGLFEIAGEGTVFLDEIAELSPASQAKILRLIQENRVRRIGGAKEIPIQARIITATNRNLERMVEERTFRQDLYYRINVLPIHIPPLKERSVDIAALAEHFLFGLAARLNKKVPGFSPSAMDKLCHHHWPGNIRELKNVVERAAILTESATIQRDAILFSHEIASAGASFPSRKLPADIDGKSLKYLVAEYERQIISSTLIKSKSVREASRKLNMSHTALLNKMKKLGIHYRGKG